jgi:hypothetical protein
MSKKKQRRCRICKKRPVWTRGDVKDPGPVCKRCYHKHVWPERKARAKGSNPAAPGIDTEFGLSDVIDPHPWFGDECDLIYDHLWSGYEPEMFWDVEEDEILFNPAKDEFPFDPEEDKIPFDPEDNDIPFDSEEDDIPF